MSSASSPSSPVVPANSQLDSAPTEERSKVTYDFSKFQLDSILSNATNRKMITCLGRFLDLSSTDQAIVLFEKNPFDERHFKTNHGGALPGDEVVVDDGSGDGLINDVVVEPGFFSSSSVLKERFTNDIYGTFECSPNPAVNSKSHFVFYVFISVFRRITNLMCLWSCNFLIFAAVKTTVIYPATANHIKKYSTQEVFIFTESPEDYRTKTLPHLEAEQFSLEVSVCGLENYHYGNADNSCRLIISMQIK